MANVTELTIKITGKDQASGVLSAVEKKAGGLGSALGKVGTIAAGFLSAQNISAGVQKLTGFLSDCTAAAKEAAAVEAQLGAVLASTGGKAGVTAEQAKKLASEMQRLTNYDDEAVLSAENMLLTFTNIGKDVFPDTTKAVLDMATAMKTDLKSASILVGKALQNPVLGVTALQRAGVRLTESQKETIKSMVEMGDTAGAQKIILKELAIEFAGSAEAAVAADGGMTQMSNRMGDLQEKIGAKLLPVMVKWKEIQLGVFEAAMKLGPVLQSFGDQWLPVLKTGFDTAREAAGRVVDVLSPLLDRLRPIVNAVSESGAVSVAAAAIIGGVLVAAFVALGIAAGTAAIGVIAATWPIIAIGAAIGATAAAIFLAVKHWDDITAAVKRARDWFLNASPPVKALATVLALPAIPLIALGVGINKLVTGWSSAWATIKSVAGSVVNAILGFFAGLIHGIADVMNFLANIADKIPDSILGVSMGAHAVKEALHGMVQAAYDASGYIDGLKVSWGAAGQQAYYFANAALTAAASLQTGLTTGTKTAVGWIGKWASSIKTAADAAKAFIPPLDDAGEGLDAAGGGAAAAAAGLDDAAKAALEARSAFIKLHSSTGLYIALGAEATVTELRLTDAITGGITATVQRKSLLEAEIGVLQEQLQALQDTGGGNDVLAESIQATIDKLQREADSLGTAKDRLIMFGEDAVGPVSAAIRDMTDAISAQSSALSGLLSVKTQEEAQLESDIAYLDQQIEQIDTLAGATRGLTEAEQWQLDVAEKRNAAAQKNLETIEDTIRELERKEAKEGELSTAEETKLQKAQERRDELRQLIEDTDRQIERLEKLADTETEGGKRNREAIDGLKERRDALQDELEGITSTKDARQKALDSMISGRPTMEEWTKLIVGSAIETGVLKEGILQMPPALTGWARAHGQFIFDTAKGIQLLGVAQGDFLRGSRSMLDEWTAMWGGAAAEVVAAMASVNGGAATPAATVPALQGGGYIRRGGLALLHTGEAVIPASRVRGVAVSGSTTVIHQHIHVGEQGIFMGDTYAMRKLADWMRAQGFVRKQDLR